MHTREEKIEAFGRLLDVLDELRVKCPWGRVAGKVPVGPEADQREFASQHDRRSV